MNARWCEDRHSKNRTDSSRVLYGMVRITGGSIRETGTQGNNHHGVPLVGDIVTNLLQAPKGWKVCNRIENRQMRLGQPRGNPHASLLAHSYIRESVRKLTLKDLYD
jgi:hypothetical protein